MATIQRQPKTYRSPLVIEYVFNKYLELYPLDEIKHSQERHYDHLGLIDTLGNDSDVGKFTVHYSCECGCLFGYKTPLGQWIVYYDFGRKEVKVLDSLNSL